MKESVELVLLPLKDTGLVSLPLSIALLPLDSISESLDTSLNPAPLTLKIWTVPLSLETASHCAFWEKQILYISALSAPRRTY